jgi:cobalt-zinc-cadmium efflux system outer membrane protein
LNQQIGRPVNAPLDVAEPLPAVDMLPSLDAEMMAALANRPDRRQASLQIDRAEAELKLANAKRWEDWSAGLGVQQSRQSIVGAPIQPADRALAFNVTIPLPLKSRSEGLISEAAVGVRKSRAQSDALTQQIGSEVGSAHAEAQSLQILYKNYESTLLPVTARNVELAQKGYEQGLVPLLEVIQAQRQAADLRTNALSTLDLYLQAYARLRTAVGDFPLLNDDSP